MANVVQVDIAHYLLLTSRGTAYNAAFTVPAGTVSVPSVVNNSTNPIIPLIGDTAIYVTSVQFDGVSSGQVGWQMRFGRHLVTQFAVQGTPVEVGLYATGALEYSVESSQTGITVVNFNLISLPEDVVIRDIGEMLRSLHQGGPFDQIRAGVY